MMRLEVQDSLPFPDHLDIELTNACNLRCSMCPRSQMTRPVGYMTKDTLNRVLVDAVGRVTTCYLHQMGEPLLHPDYDTFIRLAKQAGLWTSFSTNASLLTFEHGVRVIRSGLDHIVIAFDSMDPEVYSSIRVGSNFDKAKWNIEQFLSLRKYLEMGPLVDIQMVVMGKNEKEVEEFQAYWGPKVEGVGRVMLSPVVDWASTVRVDGVDKSIPFVCTMLNYSLTVQWDGNVCVCCRDFNGKTLLGNIHKETLLELWHSQKVESWRRAIKSRDVENMPEFCRGCFR